MMHKISIIIPIYNAEKYLKICLDSVIEQTYENIEIICVNDGSKDNSLEILREYQKKDNRIIIIDKKNEGVSEARNDGIKKSTGEYVTFVDADDWIEKDAIETLYNILISKNVDVVRGNYYVNFSYTENYAIGKIPNIINKKLETSQVDFVDLVMKRILNDEILCYVVLLLIKKEKLMQTNLFDKDILFMEDVIFYNKLMDKIESIYFIDKPLYHYYFNNTSCTRKPEHYIRNMYNLLDVHKILVKTIKDDKFPEKNRVKIITSEISNKIAGFFFSIYLLHDKSKKELIAIMDELLEDEYFCQLFQSVDYTLLPRHLVIPIKLILKKRYNILFIYYFARENVRKLKR